MMKFLRSLLSLLLFTITIYVAYENLRPYLLVRFGLTPEEINVSGTGSMYPTFPKGEGRDPKELSRQVVASPGMLPYPNGFTIFGHAFFNHQLVRGDIVVFYNPKTAELTKQLNGFSTGFVKRIIGLPGETIQVRDGLVLVNNAPLLEPYIAHAHSTFGGKFLPDCRPLTIPAHKYFVMGDNRTGSGDSRHDLGLVDEADIDHVLPLTAQKGTYDNHWRDTSQDLSNSSKIRLDTAQYLQLLNQKRLAAHVPALKYDPRLERSATLRGQAMLATNDFSFIATESGLTTKTAMAKSGYSNIIWGESQILGYYTADEYIENQFEFPDSKKFILNPRDQDIGLAQVEGLINSCPTQVIVLHVGGYQPPNYPQATVDSWATALTTLQQSQTSWANLVTSGDFYTQNKSLIDQINSLMALRISHIQAIVSRMRKNQWLTDQEQAWADQDAALAKQIFDLTTQLNHRLQPR